MFFIAQNEKNIKWWVSKLTEDYYCDCKNTDFTLTLNPIMFSFNPKHIYTFIFTLWTKKKVKNKLKLGFHSIKQSMSSFHSQILKKNYARQCNKALDSCVEDDDQDS